MVIETTRKSYARNNEPAILNALIESSKSYQLFRQLPLLSDLTDQAMQDLYNCMEERKFTHDDIFYTGGSTSSRVIHLVLDGKVNAIDPFQEVFTQLSTGDVFGVLSFLDGQRPHAATLRAASDGTLLMLDRCLFDVITLEDPAMGNQLLFFMFRLLSMTSLKLETEYANMHHFALGRGK
ncbi:MAG: hypothetical protein CO186_04505 [Zetaproteobacteria bacterium CG_4_9_14_3_um_filter_49_83]|nr:MAG: hypothetical protein AUJ56_00825 [Zetaproteobacteria bacterium CG1_02_49_23]PIQ31474.1 MAG: hypothetical protein COW62_09395 [Zetaproteobacteria bacterium CG17_big_fil_post_rev_8_21_14_2_50_50_13]PIV30962.1 MAG: hypothetical protein COS35_03890 [Zetaproteobacteria bacterium CG02_land_8_20_14_3_00_50_9]PIY54647.1 MAG: hypothetical protein COZ00_13975 [Zetaproteobacteria bacterium CG_4_10_14_0_8_um_filter_49_80]PJA35622.1 MAG: hypothetical protein CO186_04505 [Zetaproteobacteria bacterium